MPPGPHTLLSPHFVSLISLLCLRSLCGQQQLLGLRKACWAISWMPLSLLVLGKPDKEQLGVPPQAPACCQRGAASPCQPGVSVGRWHVRAGSGSPCLGRVAACSYRQGCCLPRGYSGEILPLKGEPCLSCPSFSLAARFWLKVSKAIFSSFHQCFRSHSVLPVRFCIGLSLYRQPEKQLSGVGRHVLVH